ncbi:hypothetical protein OUZ56_013441 [Daphnia magna]|uniref:Uncharacterized protein n=1 Tax=Daphnia magna TaxID=35525 RepID=A0ABQ9Z5X0_9CRUS|nr:hypothetical protein OUZ56_013441 [Daphnia magna]
MPGAPNFRSSTALSPDAPGPHIHIFVILVKFGVDSMYQLKIPENRQKSLMKNHDFDQIRLLAKNTSVQPKI